MEKGSGTTRSGGPGSPRGLAEGGTLNFNSDIKAIRQKGFTDMGGGVWELNTPRADTSIVFSDSPLYGKRYELNIVGAEGKDGVYTTHNPNRAFSILSEAKRAAREELERYYRQVNS